MPPVRGASPIAPFRPNGRRATSCHAAMLVVCALIWQTGTAIGQTIEPPRAKPAPDAAVAPAYEPEPMPEREVREEPVVDERVLEVCERQLIALGVRFERGDPIVDEESCGVAAPYHVSRIADGVVVKPATELSCETVLATARWVHNVVMPAATALGDGVRLAGLTHASTYVCRHRNGIATAKVSEHATGSAIDIREFDFDGHGPVPVVPRAGSGSIEEAFQRAVRAGACLYFTTVLGPGSDDFHSDHLHLDLTRRGGGWRLCQ